MSLKTIAATVTGIAVLGLMFTIVVSAPAEALVDGESVMNLFKVVSELDARVAALEVERSERKRSERTRQQNSVVATASGDDSNQYVHLKPIVVNLNEGSLTRYVRCSFVLKLKSDADEQALHRIELASPIVRDWMFRFLSDEEISTVKGLEAIQRICDEVTKNVNRLLGDEAGTPIENTLISEFNIQ